MRGAKPKPEAIKVATNSYHQNPSSVQVDGDLYSAPSWMTQEQREQWHYAIDNSPDGLLKCLDREILTTWVVAVCLHREATMNVAKSGMIILSPDKGIPMQSPYMAIINKQAVIIARTAAEMGFTPSARSRISINPIGGKAMVKQSSPLHEFLN